MSIVAMKKVLLVTPFYNINKVLKILQKAKIIHIVPIKSNKMHCNLEISKKKYEYTNKLLTKLYKLSNYIKIKGYSYSSKLINKIDKKKFWQIIDNIDININKKNELSRKTSILQKEINLLKDWNFFDPTIIKNIEKKINFKINIGIVKKKYIHILNNANFFFNIIKRTPQELYVICIYRNNIENINFITIPLKNITTLQAELYNNIKKIKNIEQNLNIVFSLKNMIQKYILSLKNEKEILKTHELLYMSHELYGLEGFIPAYQVSTLLNLLYKKNVAMILSPPSKNENVPVLLKNNWFFRGFEIILKMFSGISYHEKDVTPIIGCLFMWFGSLCFLDGGYGVLLALLGWCLIKKNINNYGFVLLFTGACASIVGVLNGQIFGLIVGKEIMTHYSPIFSLSTSPVTCLVFSLIMGVFNIGGGFIVAIWQRGYKTSATGSLFLVCACIFYLLGIMWHIDNVINKSIFIFILLLSVMAWILYPRMTFGNKRSIGNSIYSICSGYLDFLQDTLSHMRLFGISLSGAILALVVNEISCLFPIYIQIPFCVFGHSFVFILSLLSLCVHTNRLIFLEFGSKCIDGGQFYYLPLGRS